MSSPVEIGTVIRGKYRVDRVLGEGGMGVVAAAWHLVLEQRVAIKFLRPEMLEHPEITARFLREARAASRIESDHVARVIDVDALDDGVPFMVLEYLEGCDLSTVRAGGRGLAIEVAVDYVLQACKAVAEAHAHGIIHRDLKPANLFLAKRRDGVLRVKVLDFGISKLTDAGSNDSGLGMTQAAVVMGSIEYMSPEQMLSSRDVDARTDIWALGVILFELLTGTVPFPGETLTQVCALVMSTEPPRARALRADIPEGLEQVILWCLAKDRDRRFPSVEAFVAALQPFGPAASSSLRMPASVAVPPVDATRISGQYPNVSARDSGARAASAIQASTAMPPPATTTGSGGSATISAVSSSRAPITKRASGPVVVVAGAVLVTLAAGVWFATRSEGAPNPASSATPPITAAPFGSEAPPTSLPSSIDGGASGVVPVVAPASVPAVAPAGSAAPSAGASPGDHSASTKKPPTPTLPHGVVPPRPPTPPPPPPPPHVTPQKPPTKPAGGGID